MTTRWSLLLTVKHPAVVRWFVRSLTLQKPQSDIQLAADATGRWALRPQPDAPWHVVALTRWWRGPFWVTLTLVTTNTPIHPTVTAESARIWTLTLWRRTLSADDWRTLNVLLRAARESHRPLPPHRSAPA